MLEMKRKIQSVNKLIRGSVLAGALLVLVGTSHCAYADVFDLSWTGAFGPGSATLTATDIGGGVFNVTALSGTQNGSSISLIPSDAYGSNDNDIYQPPNTDLLDLAGLGFTDGVLDYNLFLYTRTGQSNPYTECRSDQTVCESNPDFDSSGLSVDTLTITPETSPVPEPMSVALLATAALTALGLSRRRTAAKA
jgi:hypothetical protein